MIGCERRLQNRVVLCMVALCLLWMTSLQVSLGVVEWAGLDTPTLGTVVDQCVGKSFEVADQQRRQFEECARLETRQCESLGQASFAAESARVLTMQRQNEAVVQQLQQWQAGCGGLFEATKSALTAWRRGEQATWGNVNGTGSIDSEPTTGMDSSCFGPIDALLQDVPTAAPTPSAFYELAPTTRPSSRQSIWQAAASYSQSSDNTVSHLASYSAALTSYNVAYLANKTHSLQLTAGLAVSTAIDAMSLPEYTAPSLASLDTTLSSLLSCIALDPSAVTSTSTSSNGGSEDCELPASVRYVSSLLFQPLLGPSHSPQPERSTDSHFPITPLTTTSHLILPNPTRPFPAAAPSTPH